MFMERQAREMSSYYVQPSLCVFYRLHESLKSNQNHIVYTFFQLTFLIVGKIKPKSDFNCIF